jgi:hypothetical protein
MGTIELLQFFVQTGKQNDVTISPFLGGHVMETMEPFTFFWGLETRTNVTISFFIWSVTGMM